MKLLVLLLLILQFGPRVQLRPAETLLDPATLEAIRDEGTRADGPDISTAPDVIQGTEASAGELLLATDGSGAARRAMLMLRHLIDAKRLPRPSRTIRCGGFDATPASNTKAAIVLRGVASREEFLVQRNLWATASISDEVVELFARHFVGGVGSVQVGSPTTRWEAIGIPTTGFYYHRERERSAAIVAAASAYFLATLPNAGAEALLSHLTVGAHARLAEDGRKAVAMMGSQQRASAEVLIFFGQAIEREQRRMQSFERYMPEPVDPMLRNRIADMEKGITSVWTSIGVTSSPFVPAAQRIRGRGGEDNRVPSRIGTIPIKPIDPPTAFLTFEDVNVILYELTNFIDGRRTISDIRDAVSAEFRPLAISSVSDYFDRLAKTGAITLK